MECTSGHTRATIGSPEIILRVRKIEKISLRETREESPDLALVLEIEYPVSPAQKKPEKKDSHNDNRTDDPHFSEYGVNRERDYGKNEKNEWN